MLPATCSVNRPNGRRVSRVWLPCTEHARHCCRVPCSLPRAMHVLALLRPLEVDAELVPSLTRTLSASSSPLLTWPLAVAVRHHEWPGRARCYRCPTPPRILLAQATFLGRVQARAVHAAATRSSGHASVLPPRQSYHRAPCLRGQRASGCRGPRCGCPWVRLAVAQPQHCPLWPPTPSPAGQNRPPAGPLASSVLHPVKDFVLKFD